MEVFNNIKNSIFDLADINMNLNEGYNDFYQRFRNLINCHLIKSATQSEFLEDEIISPTFENVIIVWCLHKIDVKLPRLSKQAFNHKLVNKITLKHLQKEIFNRIPELLSKKDVSIKDEIKSAIEDDLNQKKVEKDLSDWKEEEIEVKYEEEEEVYFVEKSFFIETAELTSETADTLENAQAYTRRKPGRNCNKQNNLKVQSYSCEFCSKKFTSRRQLQTHIQKKHEVRFNCKGCEITLTTQQLYDNHLKELHPDKYEDSYDNLVREKPFLCRYCLQPQASLKTLKEHIAEHCKHGELEYKDVSQRNEGIVDYNEEDNTINELTDDGSPEQDSTTENFGDRDEKDDLLLSSNLSPDKKFMGRQSGGNFPCNQCGRRFQSKRNLKSHEQNNHSVEPCACEFCNKEFINRRQLQMHILMRHEVKFFCETCDQTLATQKLYDNHLKAFHENKYTGSYNRQARIYPYLCRYCREPQESHQALRSHTLNHVEKGEIDFIETRLVDANGLEADAAAGIEVDGNGYSKKESCVNDNDDEMGNNDLDFDIKKTVNLQAEIDPRSKHQCNECAKRFPNSGKLLVHFMKHDTKPNICEFCDKTFRNRRVLQGHIKNMHRLAFKCKHCGSMEKGQLLYERHLQDCHKEDFKGYYGSKLKADSHTCRFCHEDLVSHEDLKTHTLDHIHKQDLSFYLKEEQITVENNHESSENNDGTIDMRVCDVCGKSVSFRSLHMHMKGHSSINLKCGECNLDFQDRKTYFVHMRRHKRIEVVASCEECGQTFTHHASLQKHMKMHENGGKKFKCETCKRTFYTKKAIGSHVCKHNVCDICGEKFQRARNLEMHKKMHYGEVIFPCGQCESLFLTKKKHRAHVRELHEKERKYKCDMCEKRFQMKGGLVEHMRTHTGEKPYKCNECGLRFTQKGNLEVHVKLHTNEMPFECVACKSKFRQAGDLKRHREFHKCGFSQEDFYANEQQKAIGGFRNIQNA